MQQRLEQLELTVKGLIEQYLPIMVKRAKAAEDRIAVLEAKLQESTPKVSSNGKRSETRYDVYRYVMRYTELGVDQKAMAKILGIPYTTIRKYVTWDGALIEEKLARFVEQGGDIESLEFDLAGLTLPEAEDPYAWREWTDKDRAANKTCATNLQTVVVAQLANGTNYVPAMQEELPWGEQADTTQNIVRWRLATKEEIDQFRNRTGNS